MPRADQIAADLRGEAYRLQQDAGKLLQAAYLLDGKITAPRVDETARLLPAMLRTTALEIETHFEQDGGDGEPRGVPPLRANTCRLAAEQLERYMAT